MKRLLVAGLVFALGSVAMAQQATVPEIAFTHDADYFKLPPDMHFGEVGAVALNSKGHFFIYDRNGAVAYSRLLEFGPDGKFVRQIGKDLYGFSWAEKVRIDKDDNIWAVDGSNMVIKFNPQGRVMMTLGRKWELYSGVPLTGSAQPVYLFGQDKFPEPRPTNDAFNRPTDVDFDAAGNIYVADGHTNFGGNARWVKYDKHGSWVRSVGGPGKEPGQFDTPHALVVDPKGNVYVGDRGNNRIQVFDGDGKLIKVWNDMPGGAMCLTPGPNPIMFAANGGRIMKIDLNGKVLGALGTSGRAPGRFATIHGLACKSDSEIYVAELFSWRVQKLTLKGTSNATASR